MVDSVIMGVRRLFSRGGQNFPGGSKNILFAYKMPENIQFSFKKVKKTYYFGQPRGGGQCPLLPSPADAHANHLKFQEKTYYGSLVLQMNSNLRSPLSLSTFTESAKDVIHRW